MPGVPIFHLHTRPPSPLPLAFSPLADTTTVDDPEPLPPTPTLKKKKSILKKMAIPITWGDQPDAHSQPQHHHNKLQKKNVNFTPPASSHSDHATFTTSTAHPQFASIDLEAGLPTPETTPVSSEKKAKKGVLSGMFGKNTKITHIVLPPTPPHSAPPSAAHFGGDQSEEGGLDPWHHHTSYFPEYEPIHPPSDAVPGLPGVSNHSTYFPDYTPVFHTSHPVHAYPGASGALAYALSTPEAEAAAHAQRVGHSIAIHYPDLPRFAEYQQQQQQQGGKGVSSAWQSGKWGVEGWTGFGWAGEKLPMEDGTTFGAPMPKGVPIPTEKEGGKKKKKGGDAEGGEEGEEGEEGEDGDKDPAKEDTAEGAGGDAQPPAGGSGGGGGGGGGKKKKKKKK